MRMVRVVVAVVLVSCAAHAQDRTPVASGASGSPAGPAHSRPSAPSASSTREATTFTAEQFCERFPRLADRCVRLRNAHLNAATCISDMRNVLGAARPDPILMRIGSCAVAHDTSCDDFFQCLHDAREFDEITDPDTLRACGDGSDSVVEHAVGIPRSDWEHRNGAQVTRFRDARSTKAAPIEMCGVAAATTWLTTLRCDDSSQPITGVDDAESARDGNLGRGGRCGSIIDHYHITCPENGYEIFIDAYMCPVSG
jgi:hypothetical protein